MRIHQSGRVTISVNDVVYELGVGIPMKYVEDVCRFLLLSMNRLFISMRKQRQWICWVISLNEFKCLLIFMCMTVSAICDVCLLFCLQINYAFNEK